MKSKTKTLFIFVIQVFILIILYGKFVHAQYCEPLFKRRRWIYTYNKSGNFLDEAKSIIYGPDKNLYVAGGSQGNAFWDYDFFTVISLDAHGNERWVYSYDGIEGIQDCANSIVYGGDGNLYVAGVSSGKDTSSKFTVISLDAYGNERWIYTQDGYAASIVNGTDGNIYVAGTSDSNFIVISFDSYGRERWIYTHDSGYASSIVFGEDKNLYAAGAINDTIGWGTDFAVISLDTYGNERWVQKRDGTATGLKQFDIDEAYSIVYGGDENIYAAGRICHGLMYGNFTVASFDTEGNERWIYTYNGSANWHDEAYSLVFGEDENIYAAGLSIETDCNDFTVISLTENGNERWIFKYHGPSGSENAAKSIVYGLDSNLYVAGIATFDNWWYDYTVISLTDEGNKRWIYKFNGSANLYDVANSIIYGDDDYIYTAGYIMDSLSFHDFTVISLRPSLGSIPPYGVEPVVLPSNIIP